MSKIEWTDQTWNPTTGCTKISPGCKNCYMYREYPRLTAMGIKGYENGNPNEVRLLPERLTAPLRWRKPRMVFVNSMSDLFHDEIPFEYVHQIFQVMAQARQHIFQVLTKRPERAAEFVEHHMSLVPGNVWLGTSVESQDYAHRIEYLSDIPAAVLFVSAEPLLGELHLEDYLAGGMLDWVICGGESGPKARPMELDWARTLRDECKAFEVPFFLKQLGGRGNKRGGNKAVLDGMRHTAFPA